MDGMMYIYGCSDGQWMRLRHAVQAVCLVHAGSATWKIEGRFDAVHAEIVMQL